MRCLLALAITLGVALVTSTRQRTRQPFQGNTCLDLPNGNYPDLDDCTKFHMCSHGLASRLSCPGNLHFDIETLRCEFPELAICGTYREEKARTGQQSGTAPTDTVNCRWTEYLSRDEPGAPPDDDMQGDWETLKELRETFEGQICEQPTEINARVVNTKQNATETGQHFSYYDTTTGFACISSLQDEPECFDYEVRFLCCQDVVNEFSCEGLVNGQYPDPDDCSKFYNCSNGTPYPLSCPPGLLYSEKDDQCDLPENVDCS